MKKINIISLAFITVFCSIYLSSCDRTNPAGTANQDLAPIVTVKDKTLYNAEVKESIPLGSSTEDSIAIAEAYINMWINDQLMYDKAKQNVTNQSDIDVLVEDYRRSLTINTYQEQLLKEFLAKSVSESELGVYYEQNKDKFKIGENIIKGLYLKIPVNSSQLNNFQKWYKQGTDDAIENIEKNTLQNVVGYEYFYDRWIDLDDVINNMPLFIDNQKQFLQTNKNIEAKDSTFVYLLNIKEYKLAGGEAPYEYIKGQLTEIFTEQRKSDYMKQVKKDLFDKATSDEEIKFYNK